MPYHQTNFTHESNLSEMLALVHNHPDQNLHIVDLPYRLCSWTFDYPENVGLWRDEHGQLLAWAALQIPFWTIDYACRPGLNLYQQILEWADRRAQQIVNTPAGRPAWFVAIGSDQRDRIRDVEDLGYKSQADVGEDSWSQVSMQLTPTGQIESATLPTGFTVRPLAGQAEVPAYVELHRSAFESKNMTVEWRTRTLKHPHYSPDSDLVAVAPDGRLAAFCVGWLDQDSRGEISGQIEPMGVHADFRKLGLGRAILVECLRRLQQKGATTLFVQTDNYRNAAFRLYESVGFRTYTDIWLFRKDYAAD